MGISKAPEAMLELVTKPEFMYGTGKFAETVVKYWGHAGVTRVVKPLAGALVDAGQLVATAQKTYDLSAKVLADLTNASTVYSLDATVNWIKNEDNRLAVLKTVKEVIKFALHFFCPGRASLKLVKVLTSLAIDILEQMDKDSFFGALARGHLPSLTVKRRNPGTGRTVDVAADTYSRKYQAGAVMAAKASSVAASVVFAYLTATKQIKGMAIPAARAKWLSTTGVRLMELKGAFMFTSGFVKKMA